MKVGEDNWCPVCAEWMPFDSEGKCKVCGTHINILSINHTWFEIYGVDQTEIQPNRGNF